MKNLGDQNVPEVLFPRTLYYKFAYITCGMLKNKTK